MSLSTITSESIAKAYDAIMEKGRAGFILMIHSESL